MTDKEEIIIDCRHYVSKAVGREYDCKLGRYCKLNPNCYYKQLKAKEQECEELKERLVRTEEDLKYQCVDCMNVKSDRYRKALEEIEEYCRQNKHAG